MIKINIISFLNHKNSDFIMHLIKNNNAIIDTKRSEKKGPLIIAGGMQKVRNTANFNEILLNVFVILKLFIKDLIKTITIE
tara:strand:- start:81 stop:323 length:243 start_codon:yes stop_codon:yes gene_type:complete